MYLFTREIVKERESLMPSKVQNGNSTQRRKAFLDLILEMKADGKLSERDVEEEVNNIMFAVRY